jgi:hypothetical protein
MNTAVAVANPDFSNLLDPLAKCRLVGPHRPEAMRSPVRSQPSTAAALTDAELALHPMHALESVTL